MPTTGNLGGEGGWKGNAEPLWGPDECERLVGVSEVQGDLNSWSQRKTTGPLSGFCPWREGRATLEGEPRRRAGFRSGWGSPGYLGFSFPQRNSQEESAQPQEGREEPSTR